MAQRRFQCAALAALVALVGLAGARAGERPNIVLIMADDLGVEGLGCYGGTSYATPAIDRLAANGVRFRHAYAQPLCTSTRVQLMTGRYNNRNWRAFGVLDPNAKTIGHFMQEAGYRTCMAGKWQLQSYDPPSYPGSELRRGKGMTADAAGFDRYSLYHAWHTEDKGSRYARPTLYEDGRLLSDLDGEYGPDHWVDFITGFIDDAAGDGQPFFVYYAMALPHRPFVPTPLSEDWSKNVADEDEDPRYFSDMVAYMDRCVGQVVDHVDEAGLARETLVIFYSDNGTHQQITSQTQDGPVVGGKGKTTDAGTHVPLIVRWIGSVSPGLNDNLVDSTDFLPTVMEAAGRPLTVEAGLDGISFYPQVLGRPAAPRRWVFCHYDPRPGWDKDQFRKIRFARDQRFKLYGDGKLYDVPQDPLEQEPIVASHDSDLTREARGRLAAVLDGMPNPDPEPRDGDPREAEQRLYVAADNALSVFAIDQESGALEVVQKLPLTGAGPFAFAPNRRLMYAAAGKAGADAAPASIATCEIGPNGELTLVQQAAVNLRPGYLMTDNNGEFLAGSHYREGKASIWKIDPRYVGTTLREITLEENAHSAVFSPDNHWLLVPATGPNKVFLNRFTAQVGTTVPHDPPFVAGPVGDDEAKQPRHLVFHPHLSVVYTTLERDHAGVGVWQWDTETGSLEPLQNVVTQPNDFPGVITTADLHLTPDGRFLYVSNRDVTVQGAAEGNDSIVGFRVDPQTGTLAMLGHTPCERVPRSFTIDALSRFLYVAGQGDGTVGAYRIETSGTLTKVAEYAVGARPAWVQTLSLSRRSASESAEGDATDGLPQVFQAECQEAIVPASSRLELVWGDGTFTEGPTVAPDGAVLFTDVRRQRIMRFDPTTSVTSVFREQSGNANGLAHDGLGQLLACEGADGGGRRISVTTTDGRVTNLVDNYQGKALNSPNDVAIAPDGTVYFTDPRYSGTDPRELDFEGVYLIRDQRAVLATNQVERPNGIVISASGQRAYVADNNNAEGGARALYVFDIQSNGTFANRKTLFRFGPNQRGIDGMTIDRQGNIYATAGKGEDAGVYVFGPDGAQLAVIPVPDVPTNCTFGGQTEAHTLYITAEVAREEGEAKRFGLYRIDVVNKGH